MNRLSESLTRPPITAVAGVRLILLGITAKPDPEEEHRCLLHMDDGSTRTVNSKGSTVKELADFYLGQPFDYTPAKCIKLEILS